MIAIDWPRRAGSTAADQSRPVSLLGRIDNAAEIALELGLLPPASGDRTALARLYAQAVKRWGDGADTRLIGEYAAILSDPETRSLRLSRSPLRAPPLHYHAAPSRVIASSERRAIFARGIEPRLDDAKLADQALFNFSGEERDWYHGLQRVPLGAVVEFSASREVCRRYYDIAALPEVRRANAADYLAEARHLLDSATRACLAGSTKPAVMLSGGLDSALVAAAALDVLPGGSTLESHTFVVEAGWRGPDDADRYADERPLVDAFCAMHRRVIPHFHDRSASDFDTGLDQLVDAIGSAPVNLVNLAPYHSMWRAAAAAGCDRILIGEFGNLTLSADGDWAFSEYLARLQWRQLGMALRQGGGDPRPVWRRFVGDAVLPFLPDRLWHWQRRLRGEPNIFDAASPLRRDYAAASGALERAIAAGLPDNRHPRRDRRPELEAVHNEAWGEFSDIYHGFEQIYGLEQRDPTAWRPLLEFCAGLPSELFLRDGQKRWLARELGKGVLPEALRLNRKRGLHDAGWQLRLARRKPELLAELAHWQGVPRLAEMLDFADLQASLLQWSAGSGVGPRLAHRLHSALPRALVLSRFVARIEGLEGFDPRGAQFTDH